METDYFDPTVFTACLCVALSYFLLLLSKLESLICFRQSSAFRIHL